MKEAVSDEVLMLQYRNGKADAFDILYRRHKGGVFRFLLYQCADAATTEELFQDVWMKVVVAHERYEDRAKFTTWLYHIARNRLVDYWRQANTFSRQVKTQAVDDNLPGDMRYQPQQQAEISEQMNLLEKLIDALPNEQREVFLLREEGRLTLPEIAEVTGTSVETAKSRLRYAVNKLRRGLRDGE